MTKKEKRADKFYDAYLHLLNCRSSLNVGARFYVVGACLVQAADGLEELADADNSGLSMAAGRLSGALKMLKIKDTTEKALAKFIQQGYKLWERAEKEAI